VIEQRTLIEQAVARGRKNSQVMAEFGISYELLTLIKALMLDAPKPAEPWLPRSLRRAS
jgi:hypothetical protein